MNAKRVYRLYREEGLQVRTTKRKKGAARVRVPLTGATHRNQRWSMDFVSDRLADGRWFRILTVVDQYTRECICTYADRSQTGEKVVEQMKRLVAHRGAPESITTDNGSEFAGRAMEVWAYQAGVKLDFIRPGRLFLYRELQRATARRMPQWGSVLQPRRRTQQVGELATRLQLRSILPHLAMCLRDHSRAGSSAGTAVLRTALPVLKVPT